MKKYKIAYNIIAVILILSLFSCSGDNGPADFQVNDVEPEYRLFSLLDDHPALKNAFDNLDSDQFNRQLASVINPNSAIVKDVVYKVSDLIDNPKHPVTNLIKNASNMLSRINNQNSIDYNINENSLVAQKVGESTDYASNFYNFSDKYRDSDVKFSDDIVPILRKITGYVKNRYQGEDLEDIISDFSAFLKESTGTTVSSTIELFSEILGKVLIQSDESMYLDGQSQLMLNRENIDYSINTDTGLGNASKGIEVLISGLYDFINQSEDAREILYGLIRETGKLFSASVEGKDAKTVIKELICNIDKLVLPGGEIYDNNQLYNVNNEEVHSDANLKVLLNEIFPFFLSQLFRRSDREGSFIKDRDNTKIYPLEITAQRFNLIGFDTKNPDNLASHIEESVYEAIRSDIMGKDRMKPLAGNYKDDSFGISFIESFVNVASTTTYSGWTDGGKTGEIISKPGLMVDPAADHGHGTGTGYITLNDVFSSIGVRDIVNVNILGTDVNLGLYTLAMDYTRSGEHVSRRAWPFSYEDRDRYRFPFDQNYMATAMMSGFQTGDFGIPGGGNLNGEECEKLNSYLPHTIDGYGEAAISRWYLEAMERASFRGESPYYSTEGMTKDGSRYTYYRVDGRINLIVTKPDLNDPQTWEYKYPYQGKNDIKDPNNPENRINNRYYEKWKSDYYLVHYDGKSYTPNDMESGMAVEAGAMEFKEIVPEKCRQRECATYEESAYRNFQWLTCERKYAILVPLYLEFSGLLKGAAFLTIKSNGFNGLLDARRFEKNHVWARAGHDGFSRIPGDYCFNLDLKAHLFGIDKVVNGISVSEILKDIVYNQILGTGTVLPAFTAHTSFSATNIAFPFRDYVEDDYKINVSSSDITDLSHGDVTFKADKSDPVWNRRSFMLPLFNHLCGAWFEYANSPKEKDTLREVIDGLMPMIGRPVYYYQKKEGLYPRNTWKYRNIGGAVNDPEYGAYGDEYRGYFLTRSSDVAGTDPDCYWGGWDEKHFYMAIEDMGLVSMLLESEKRKCDGIVSLVCQYDINKPIGPDNQPNTRLLSKLFRLLYLLGDDDIFGDNPQDSSWSENDYSTWGIRRKILYGLEQITSSIKIEKEEMIRIYETDYFAPIKHPLWLFEQDAGGVSLPVRSEDISFSKILDELIGSDDTGKGLSVVADNRQHTADWDNFYKLIDAFGELLSDNGETNGKYNITEDVIKIIDKVFRSVDIKNDDIKSLVHSAGVLLTTFDKNEKVWQYPKDFNNMITGSLPEILENFQGHYDNLLTLSEYASMENGFLQYFLPAWTSSHNTGNLIKQLPDFLEKDLIDNYDSALWVDLSGILIDFADTIDAETPSWVVNAFQSNDPDPYGALGEILAK